VARPVGLFYRARARRLEKVIFTATTGRSGSKTLAALFSTIPGCAAFHEPYPPGNGAVLRAATYGEQAILDRFYRNIKSINIHRASVGARYYVEANHLFIKTFARHAVLEFGDRLAIIHLVRAPIEVAMSMYCLQHLPGTEIGDFWWLEYRAPTNIIKIADLLETDAEFSHPFYKGLWYWYETELRIAALRAEMPSLRMAHFDTAWFNDKWRVLQLLRELGIDYDEVRIESAVGRRDNDKVKDKVLPALPGEQAEQMHRRFQQLLTDRAFDISSVIYRE